MPGPDAAVLGLAGAVAMKNLGIRNGGNLLS